MRYEMVNKIHGTKIVVVSESERDKFLASCKKDKRGQIAWKVGKTLNDGPIAPKYSVAELEKMMTEAKSYEEDVEKIAEGVKSRGRPKKEQVDE